MNVSPKQTKPAKTIRLAFFADFHANNEREIDRALKLIDDALKADPKPDHIIIGGDIVGRAQGNLLKRFVAGLKKRKCQNRVTVVPGNHDIFPLSVSTRPFIFQWGKKLFQLPWELPNAEDIIKSGRGLLKPAFLRQKLFCKLFASGRNLRGVAKPGTDSNYPLGLVLSPNAVLVAFNSTHSPHDPKLWQWASGNLNKSDFDAASRFFRKHKEARHKIIVMHHSPWTPYKEGQHRLAPMGMAKPDSKKTIVQLENTGATLVLCGHWHKHHPDIGKRKILGETLIGFCAGTAGGADNEEGDNTRMYHFIDLLPSGKFNLHPRRLRLK